MSENKLAPREFFRRYIHRIVGAVLGIALGVLFLCLGFWKTLLLAALGIVGWWIGSRMDGRWAVRMKAMLARILGVDRTE